MPQPRPYQLTFYEPPDAVVAGSAWGEIRYRDWCRRETERIRAKGRPAAVRKNGGDRIAVYVEV